jgi:hypothetical protein
MAQTKKARPLTVDQIQDDNITQVCLPIYYGTRRMSFAIGL